MRIKLLKKWNRGNREFYPGTELEMNRESGKKLIKEGIGKEIENFKETPVTNQDGETEKLNEPFF